jgi:hypothetical protein
MVFFIPWRVVAEESGAAHFDLLGPRGGCWPHDGEVARGADSILAIFRFGATMELGRSERPTMRRRWSDRVDAANTPDRKPCSRVAASGTAATRFALTRRKVRVGPRRRFVAMK